MVGSAAAAAARSGASMGELGAGEVAAASANQPSKGCSLTASYPVVNGGGPGGAVGLASACAHATHRPQVRWVDAGTNWWAGVGTPR